ncbi:hypothetical protein CROQUDRAFT_668343 [Cronartium quercuum f. sp. fusiforme G11]|uniref:Restriction endonuclease type IV Mrr domain-containing protein n=1 Tax=Cronartium quercuum f. sp. fusiforme G11 TaxID=708437 RepID=A0A9P6NUV6_9BASI|nr:hypothetical protein CROQUDRAFT_668343 [Cronartium quercuum f. sp. fusiforme G11]
MTTSAFFRHFPIPRLLHTSTTPVKPHLRTETGCIYERHAITFMSAPVLAQGLGLVQVFHRGLRSSHDGGIDVSATWPLTPPLRVLAQCKDSRVELRFIRELEGTLVTTPNSPPVLGILFASRGFTRPALERAQSSSLPILLIHLLSPRLDPTATEGGFGLKGAYPNSMAETLLEPIRFVSAYTSSSGRGLERKPVLWNSLDEGLWKG